MGTHENLTASGMPEQVIRLLKNRHHISSSKCLKSCAARAIDHSNTASAYPIYILRSLSLDTFQISTDAVGAFQSLGKIPARRVPPRQAVNPPFRPGIKSYEHVFVQAYEANELQIADLSEQRSDQELIASEPRVFQVGSGALRRNTTNTTHLPQS
jgi:hypothetical protein